MVNIIAYVTSDWHIPEDAGGQTWRDVPGVSGDALHALGHVVSLCIKDHVPLIAAGDLVDSPDLTPEALAGWFNVLRPLADAELPLFAILGNHDRGRDWLQAFGPRYVRLDGRLVRLPSGHTLSGLSFTPPANFASTAANISTRVTDIGVYHQAVGEFGPGKGLNLSQFPSHPLAIIGDTHVPMVLMNRGPRLALSPGPLCPQSVAEFSDLVPGVWAITDDLDVRHVKIPSRVYRRFDISTPEEADACVAAITTMTPNNNLPDHLSRPMIAIRTTVDLDGFVPAIRELVGRQNLPLRVLDATAPTTSSRLDVSRAGHPGADLVGIISSWPALTPGARSLALALSDSNADPGELLDADRAAWEADPDEPDQFDQVD